MMSSTSTNSTFTTTVAPSVPGSTQPSQMLQIILLLAVLFPIASLLFLQPVIRSRHAVSLLFEQMILQFTDLFTTFTKETIHNVQQRNARRIQAREAKKRSKQVRRQQAMQIDNEDAMLMAQQTENRKTVTPSAAPAEAEAEAITTPRTTTAPTPGHSAAKGEQAKQQQENMNGTSKKMNSHKYSRNSSVSRASGEDMYD